MKYTVNEVAEILGVHISTVSNWCRKGKLKAHKEATHQAGLDPWMISDEDLRVFLATSYKYCRIWLAMNQVTRDDNERAVFLKSIREMFK